MMLTIRFNEAGLFPYTYNRTNPFMQFAPTHHSKILHTSSVTCWYLKRKLDSKQDFYKSADRLFSPIIIII